MSRRIKGCRCLCDSLARNPARNMKALPESEWRNTDAFQCQLITDNWYVNF
ncbi:MAG: hypothetical protein PHP07_06710 [Eubacteriales bacterium]|nr:hypothetical protein [Eubacteriales bacterium]MDD3572617.1 hypothetical protein [Eubacteriales bacterium]NLO13685.1 hypothetical protein [Clostridiales bacterium]